MAQKLSLILVIALLICVQMGAANREIILSEEKERHLKQYFHVRKPLRPPHCPPKEPVPPKRRPSPSPPRRCPPA
ncbi:hypothetical protein CIPAW_02G061800 [Carya illinoinensis]|uniref:Uncharacterized protein n=1 Tax=Carya illinoinensis TaxID=32201 RepID=A0A8T1RAR2_CARIL|nr:hypothetical protein CIPAW_02G061800 [Carya illinoinensis]